jgi:hypothetical protein
MSSLEDIQTVNKVFEGYSTLQSVHLRTARQYAEVTFTIDRGVTESGPKEYCVFCLTGIAAACVLTKDEPLPPELKTINQASAELLDFVAAMFREQYIYECDLFSPARLNWAKMNFAAATWRYGEPTHLDLPSLGVFLERPLESASSAWELRLWFSELKVHVPGGVIGQRELSLARFAEELKPLEDRTW